MKSLRSVIFLLSPIAIFSLVLLGGSYYLRHEPLILPSETRYPGLKKGIARALSLRYLGVAGFEVSDGKTVVLIDPVLTRPTLSGLFHGPLTPDEELLEKMCPKADFILIKHAHYDHALDAPSIALRTGATIIGSQSVINLALSRGVPRAQTLLVKPGDRYDLQSFKLIVREYKHSKILGMDNVMVGTIAADAGKLWWWQYLQDGSMSYRLESGGASVWIGGPSTFEEGEPEPAGTLLMGASGHAYSTDRMARVLARARPDRLFLSHYDNFFQPFSKGIGRFPVTDIERLRGFITKAAPHLPLHLLDYDETAELPLDSRGGLR